MSNAWLDELDDEGESPMSRALECGNASIVQLLMTVAQDEEAPETSGEHEIHGAARRGDVQRVRECLEAGADIEELDRYGLSLLHWAGLNGSLDLAKLMVNRGKEVVTIALEVGGLTPMAMAQLMRYEAVAALLEGHGGMR